MGKLDQGYEISGSMSVMIENLYHEVS